MVNTDISNLGLKQYEISQVLFDKVMISTKYKDYVKNIDIEGKYGKLVIKEDGYVKKIMRKASYNTTLKDLINESLPPIIRGYYDSNMKDICTYSIEFKAANKNILLEFDKHTVTVYTPHNGLVLVYQTNDKGIMISGALLESYHLLDEGFIYTNYANDTSTLYYDNFRNNIKFCFNIRNNMGSQMLDYLPSRVYQADSYFNSQYDEFGLTKECILNTDKDMMYCVYTREENKITSIHPMIFDPFAALYDTTLVDYWVVDTLEMVDKDTKVFDRVVYKVLNVYDLLCNINS